jgi:hypothetical protein
MDEKVRWSPSLETLQYSPRVSLWRHHRKVLLPYTASASLLSTLLGFFQVMAEAAAHCHFAPTVPDPLQPSSLVKHCANGRVAGRGSGLRDREFRKDLLDPLERLLCRGQSAGLIPNEVAGLCASIRPHNKCSFGARYSDLRCWPKALRILVIRSKAWCRTPTA